MKRTMILLMVLMLIITGCGMISQDAGDDKVSEPSKQPDGKIETDPIAQKQETIEGVVTDRSNDGSWILVQDDNSLEYRVNLSESTVYEGISEQDIKKDNRITVNYSGAMTRSIPPQISALKIKISDDAVLDYNTIKGRVSAMAEDASYVNILEANGMETRINISDDTQYVQEADREWRMGNYVEVEVPPMMQPSIPPQTNAHKVLVNEPRQQGDGELMSVYRGSVTDISDDGMMVTIEDERLGTVILNIDDETKYSDGVSKDIEAGNYIIAGSNGIQTFSIPPQAPALKIIENVKQ